MALLGKGKATRIVHHGKGYAALIKQASIQQNLYARAKAIATAAGGEDEGFYARSSSPHTRARAVVIAPKGDSGNKMLRNLDAGR